MLHTSVITALAVILSIGLHFTTLLFTTKVVGKFHGAHPATIVFSLLLAVIAHLLEILVFAVALQYMYTHDMITFSIDDPHFLDIFYFSGTTYTTVGYGDIVLVGAGRTVAVIESVMGLVLIGWTTAFTYYEINRKWIRQT
jgi:mannose/fructose/N-acetylgalactosamine-specific phosphotransferase system component IIC